VASPGAAGTGRPGRRHSIAAAVGRGGVLSVIRDLGLRDRYRGDADLTTGEIDEDVEHYLRTSEQIDSALGCEALVDRSAAVIASAGLLLQCLPGSAAGPQVREAQHALRTGRLAEALAAGVRQPVDLARLIVAADEPLEVVDQHALRFACPCSRGRVIDMLAGLPEAEHTAMIAAGKPAEVTCEFCRTRYEVGLDALRALAARPRGTA
jgi:molecular chaperone Hsp33